MPIDSVYPILVLSNFFPTVSNNLIGSDADGSPKDKCIIFFPDGSIFFPFSNISIA